MRANGSAALATWAPDGAGGLRAHSVQVLEVAGGLVRRNVTFADPRALDRFSRTG